MNNVAVGGGFFFHPFPGCSGLGLRSRKIARRREGFEFSCMCEAGCAAGRLVGWLVGRLVGW